MMGIRWTASLRHAVPAKAKTDSRRTYSKLDGDQKIQSLGAQKPVLIVVGPARKMLGRGKNYSIVP